MRKLILLQIILGIFTAPFSLFAQQTSPELPPALVEEIESRINGGYYVGLQIGVWDSTGMHYYGFGKTALKDGTTPDENTLFEIGSISKVFTGILLADRVEEGRMKLEDPISKYLPDSIDAPQRNDQQIVLRQLSTHTSGLPRMPTNLNIAIATDPFADYDAEKLYTFLSSYQMKKDIGSEALYSNLAVGLLGHLMSLDAGKPYEELLKENVCEPLDLQNTTISMTPDQRARLAKPHSRGLNNHIWHFDCLAACGAVRSTAADMLQFLAANAFPNGPLEEQIRLSQKVHGEEKLGNANMGLGWLIVEREGERLFLHDGATGGYRAFAAVIEGKQKAVVVFSNSTTDGNDIAMSLLTGEDMFKTLRPTFRAEIINEIKVNGVNKGIKKYKQHRKEKTKGYAFSANQLNMVGTYFLQIEEFETAQKIFKKNQKMYPKDANVLFGLGEVAASQGQTEQAESYYRQCLDLRKNHPKAKQKLEEMGLEFGE